MPSDYDLLVLGAGPGGYIAAIRAAQLGLKTAVVEREEVGGICLNWGCIPSKALLRNAEVLNLFQNAATWGVSFDGMSYDMGAAIDRSRRVVNRVVKGVQSLFKKHGIAVHYGAGRLTGPGTVAIDATGETLRAANLIIATGGRSRDLSNIKVDGETVIASREALELRDPPGSIVIVGGGAVGVEFAYFFKAYGSEVTIIEMLPHLLPGEDEEVSQHLERALQRDGIQINTGCTVEQMSRSKGRVQLTLSLGAKVIECDKVLLGVGNSPNTENMGLEERGIETEHGFVKVNDRMATNVPGVYAIGDVTGKMPLAHVASAQGVLAVEAIAGQEPAPLDYRQMPRATYCQPQVASMGLTESAAGEQGHEVKIGRFPFIANGKAVALGLRDGFVKLVTDAGTGEILGAHLIGHDVTDMLAEISMARMLEGTALDIGRMVHAHPTLSEAVMEAGLGVSGESLNI